MDAYAILGIKPDATPDEIRTAYKKEAIRTHPDKVPEDERDLATEKFKILHNAYELLSDEDNREHYNRVHISKMKTARFLVLFDLNGTLVFRAKGSRVPGLQPIYTRMVRGSQQHVYARQGLAEFIDRLLANKLVSFAIYTSVQARNAAPIVEAALGHGTAKLFATYAGDNFNVPDPSSSDQWETKRCLPKVWEHHSCRAKGVMFDHSNTIMIDNEVAKIVDCKENALLLKPCTERTLHDKDNTLSELVNYIEELVRTCQGDVRNYIKKCPYGKPKALAIESIKPLSYYETHEVEAVDAGLLDSLSISNK
jgi:hypothetical protein